MAYLQTKNPLDYTEETTGSTSGNTANPKLTSSMSVGGFSQPVAEPAATKPLTASMGGTTTNSTPNTNVIPGTQTIRPAPVQEPSIFTTGGDTQAPRPQPHRQYQPKPVNAFGVPSNVTNAMATPGVKEQSQPASLGAWNHQDSTERIRDFNPPIFTTGGDTATPASIGEQLPESQTPQSSGMFTNLQQYLNANQAGATNMANEVAKNINARTAAANTAIKASPDAASAAVQNALSAGQLSQDEAGRAQLLRETQPLTTSGGINLDQFLMQNTQPALDTILNAGTAANNVTNTYNEAIKQQAAAKAAAAQAAQDAANKKLMDEFLSKINAQKTPVVTAAPIAKQTTVVPAQVAQTPEQIANDEYIYGSTTLNPYGLRTPEQAAKVAAYRKRMAEDNEIFQSHNAAWQKSLEQLRKQGITGNG